MRNLYAQTKSQDAMRHVFKGMMKESEAFEDLSGNLPVISGIWPDYSASIIRHGINGGWQLSTARRRMPTPATYLKGKRTDPGVTNIRNTSSPHWRPSLRVQHHCLVPFFSFSEFDTREGPPRNHPVWFALGEDRPLAFFAGIRTQWTSVRKLKEGEVTAELLSLIHI